MECERCQDAIESGEEREYAGRILCEDCYMEKIRGELREGRKIIKLW